MKDDYKYLEGEYIFFPEELEEIVNTIREDDSFESVTIEYLMEYCGYDLGDVLKRFIRFVNDNEQDLSNYIDRFLSTPKEKPLEGDNIPLDK